jgi:hypothetical protein
MINRRTLLKLGLLALGGAFMQFDSKELMLTADDLPPKTFDEIEIKIDQHQPFLTDLMIMSDGRQRLFYDVSKLPHGKHEVWLRGVKNHKFGPVTKFEFRI